MKYLKIKNTGIIEPQALSLVGASTKRGDDSFIGQFGSGNKYALAYLIRNDYELRIFSGMNEIEIETKTEKFRSHDFNILYINGEKTSITSEMGKDWQLWQALRELYCNAIDEGDNIMCLVDQVEPAEDETHFYISITKEIEDFVESFDSYFSETKKVLFESEKGRILEKTGSKANVYRKGVRCFNSEKLSVFDYDIDSIGINESRVAEYNWQVAQKIWELALSMTDKKLILRFLKKTSDKDYIESELGVTGPYRSDMSKEFIETVKNINLAPAEYAGLIPPDEIHNYILVPNKLFEAVRDELDDSRVDKGFRIGTKGIYREIENKPLYEQTIKQALDFLKEVGDPCTNVPIGTTAKNLKSAVEGETYEYTEMYPGFAKTARDEGLPELAEWFETLAKAEKSHAGRFAKGFDTLGT